MRLPWSGTPPPGLSGGGSGDVTGPASSTDMALARFDGTTGKAIEGSPARVSDGGIMDLREVGSELRIRLDPSTPVVTLASGTIIRWVDDTDISGAAATACILAGSGTPEGAVAAAVGSLYLRLNGGAGTSLYVKESGAGNTGWVAK